MACMVFLMVSTFLPALKTIFLVLGFFLRMLHLIAFCFQLTRWRLTALCMTWCVLNECIRDYPAHFRNQSNWHVLLRDWVLMTTPLNRKSILRQPVHCLAILSLNTK